MNINIDRENSMNDGCKHIPTIKCVAIAGVKRHFGAPLPFFGSFILRRDSPSSIFIFVLCAYFVAKIMRFLLFLFLFRPSPDKWRELNGGIGWNTIEK